MSKNFYGLFLVLTYSLAWAQTDTSTLLLPQPSNPVPVGDMGAHRFLVLNSNGASSNALEVSTFSTHSSKSGDATLGVPPSVTGNTSGSWSDTKSYESNVNGLQFLKPSPLYDSKENAKWNGF